MEVPCGLLGPDRVTRARRRRWLRDPAVAVPVVPVARKSLWFHVTVGAVGFIGFPSARVWTANAPIGGALRAWSRRVKSV